MNPIVNLNHRFYFHGISYAFFLLLLTPLPATAQTNDRTDYGYNNSFKPSMAVTIVILAAAFVFIALFSLYIRRCAREAHMTGGSIRGGNVRSRRAPRGLDPAIIETFPTFVYSVVKGLKIGKGTLECAVCLNEFEDDETLRLLPKCDHVFHPECIDAWLSSHTTCPVCRADLKPGEGSATEASGTNTETETESGSAEVTESQEQVLINVNEEDSSAEMINPSDITRQNRPVRMKSMKARRFSRSHSTGHSVQPGENFDRFTLRLPVDVRKQIINGKLNRSASCVAFVTRQGSVSGSVREGRSSVLFGGRFDRSGKSDRWGFSMAPPFFWRNASVRGSVKSSFDRLGAKAGDSEPPV